MADYIPPIHKRLYHQARRSLAQQWFSRLPNIKVIGITGSYGKTSTSQAITAVLQTKAPVIHTDTNLDTIYNLPITLLKARPYHRYAVLEYGVDHIGEMDFHLSLVKPDIAILTGITPVHTDPELLGSVENVITEKIKLLNAAPSTGLQIYNRGNQYLKTVKLQNNTPVITYSSSSPADYRAIQIKPSLYGTSLVINTPKKKKIKMHIGLIGTHFAEAALIAYILGQHEGVSIPQIRAGLAALKPSPGRMSIEHGRDNILILNDSLRANPASTTGGLQTFHHINHHGRKIAILAEMRELGESSEQEHLALGKLIAQLSTIDLIIGIGNRMHQAIDQAVGAGFKSTNTYKVTDLDHAWATLQKLLQPHDFLYLKGSLKTEIYKIADRIKK